MKVHLLGYFNPRTRVGCDRLEGNSDGQTKNFNPRTRVGCDGTVFENYRKDVLFQSTHPCGVRRGRK